MVGAGPDARDAAGRSSSTSAAAHAARRDRAVPRRVGVDARRHRRHRRPRAPRARDRTRRRRARRGAAHALLGLAAWTRGDLDAAFAEYTESIARMRRIGHIADLLGVRCDGRHPRRPGPPPRSAATLRAGLAPRRRPRPRPDARRRRHARRPGRDHPRARRARCRRGTSAARRRARAVRDAAVSLPLADGARRPLLAEGDIPGCLDLLEEAERVYNTDFSPAVRPVGARRART